MPELMAAEVVARMLWLRLLDTHGDQRGMARNRLLLTLALVAVVVVAGLFIYNRVKGKDHGPPAPIPGSNDS